jgi:AraC family transcriptional regulator, activator of mtrCDE
MRDRSRRGSIRRSATKAAAKPKGGQAVTTALPGTLDGAVDRLALCEVPADSPFDADGATSITLHCVLAGTLVAQIDGRPPLIVPAGSALLLPVGEGICLAADRRDGERLVRVLIGNVTSTAAAALGLADLLRHPLVHDLGAAPGAAEMLQSLAREVAQPVTGTVLIAAALMKLYLVQASRCLAGAEAGADSRVSKAVSAILTEPGAPHSIALLAERVGMSRATFIRHFSRATGVNPMQFVAKARLDHAAELLRSTSLPVKAVAGRIGFNNRSHFSRAFRRAHGVDPSAFRNGEAADERPNLATMPEPE